MPRLISQRKRGATNGDFGGLVGGFRFGAKVGGISEDGGGAAVKDDERSPALRQALEKRAEPFVLSAEEVRSLLAPAGGPFDSVDHLLTELTRSTSGLSIPPISNFHVSCAALGESGRIFVGVNVEFEHLPLPCALHAEQFLILNCFQRRETSIEKLCISHVPCGHCRQFMCELHKSEQLEITILGRDGER